MRARRRRPPRAHREGRRPRARRRGQRPDDRPRRRRTPADGHAGRGRGSPARCAACARAAISARASSPSWPASRRVRSRTPSAASRASRSTRCSISPRRLDVTLDELLSGDAVRGYQLAAATTRASAPARRCCRCSTSSASACASSCAPPAAHEGRPDERHKGVEAVTVAAGLVQIGLGSRRAALRAGEALVAEASSITAWASRGDAVLDPARPRAGRLSPAAAGSYSSAGLAASGARALLWAGLAAVRGRPSVRRRARLIVLARSLEQRRWPTPGAGPPLDRDDGGRHACARRAVRDERRAVLARPRCAERPRRPRVSELCRGTAPRRLQLAALRRRCRRATARGEPSALLCCSRDAADE